VIGDLVAVIRYSRLVLRWEVSMKAFLSSTIIVLVAILAITTWARAQAPGDRPSGVDEGDWVALSDTVGIVLVDVNFGSARYTLPPGVPRELSGLPRSTGVLMVKVNGFWTRLEWADAPPRVQPAY
jgi:hypothetical protein